MEIQKKLNDYGYAGIGLSFFVGLILIFLCFWVSENSRFGLFEWAIKIFSLIIPFSILVVLTNEEKDA